MKKGVKTATKIIKWEKINQLIELINKKNSVLVGGCFDLLHFGHLIFLKKAKKEGDFLVIILESDEFIKKRKKRSPIHTQRQRAITLAALEMVDLVILIPYFKSDNDYLDLVKKIRPKVIAVTAQDPQKENKKKQGEIVGAKFKIVVPRLKQFASSKILKAYAPIFSD